jgi:hypothetical protein
MHRSPVKDSALAFCLFLHYVCFMFDEIFDRITQNPAVMGQALYLRYAAALSQWQEVALAEA